MRDATKIAAVIQAFYDVFDNRNNRIPTYDKLLECCVSQLLIVRQFEENTDFYSLDQFWEPRQKLLTDGRLRDFYEFEISGETFVVGNIAHHKSRYQKNGFLNGEVYSGEGNKSFQLVNTNQGWKICSVVWEDIT